MAGIGELSVSVTARTGKAIKNIRSFRKSVGKVPGVVKKASSGVAGLTTAFAGLAGVAGVTHQLRKSFENIDKAGNTAKRLGTTTEALAGMRLAAEETGVAANTLDTSLQRMVRRVSEAAKGSGEAVGALDELGLSAQRMNQLSPDKQFSRIADAMKGVRNQSDRVRLAFKLFDSEGAALLNTLDKGSKGLAEYRKEAKRLGLAVGEFDTARVQEANATFGRMGKSIEGLTNKIAVGLAPVVEGLSKSFTNVSSSWSFAEKDITSGLEKVGKGVGIVANGIRFWENLFMSARNWATQFFAWYVKQVERVNNTTVEMLNKLPGVSLETPKFITALSDELEKAAADTKAAADKAWARPLPSAGIDKWFSDLDKNIAKSREEFDKAAEARKKTLSGDTFIQAGRGITSMLQKQATTFRDTALGMGKSALAGITDMAVSEVKDTEKRIHQNRKAPGILDARSAQGFAQLRSSLNRGGVQQKMLDEQKKEVKETTRMAGYLERIIDKMGSTEVMGFGDA